MALTIDAFNVIRRGLVALQNTNPLIHQQVMYNKNFYNNGTKGIQCDRQPPMPWEYGGTIADKYKQVPLHSCSTIWSHM